MGAEAGSLAGRAPQKEKRHRRTVTSRAPLSPREDKIAFIAEKKAGKASTRDYLLFRKKKKKGGKKGRGEERPNKVHERLPRHVEEKEKEGRERLADAFSKKKKKREIPTNEAGPDAVFFLSFERGGRRGVGAPSRVEKGGEEEGERGEGRVRACWVSAPTRKKGKRGGGGSGSSEWMTQTRQDVSERSFSY